MRDNRPRFRRRQSGVATGAYVIAVFLIVLFATVALAGRLGVEMFG